MSPAPDATALLRSRLRIATLILAMAVGLFLIRSLFLNFAPAQFLQALITAELLGVAAVLSLGRSFSLRTLRALEILVFGSVTLFLAAHQHASVQYRVEFGTSDEVLGAARSAVMYTMALVMIYGMIIPNSWQRAAIAVVPMTIVPIGVAIVLWATLPLKQTFSSLNLVEQASDDLLITFITAFLAIYGSRVIHDLRREANEARRLGQYTLRRPIGVGGMGEVYLAEHRLLRRPCAIKLVRPDHADDAKVLDRFEREVQATARLSHPNTVEIYDYGHADDGTFYYVMEYLRGLGLDELVERHGPLPSGRVIYLLRQVCGALGEAHAAGLLHRDLKPANLFAARRGGRSDFVKVLDFGIVKSIGEDPAAPEAGQELVTGSPSYMSPEQATGDKHPDLRSDLYALGAVAYFLLTGRPPFVGTSAMSVMVSHARDPVEPPSRHRPGIASDLEAVILRLLAKKPSGRFADALALEAALAACDAAGEWDAAHAEAWWKAFEPAYIEESGLTEPSTFLDLKDRPPTTRG